MARFFWCFCVIIEEVILVFEMHTPLGFCTPLKGKRLDCMIKLIATDMDGTFLDADGQFDADRFGKVLANFDKQGIVFVASSGRGHIGLEQLFAPFKDQMAFIAENGSSVYYQGKLLFEASMTRHQYHEVVAKVLENPYNQGVEFLISAKNSAYVLPETPASYREFIKQYYGNVQLIDQLDAIEDKVMKITTNFRPEDLEQGTAWLNKALPYIQAVTTGFASIDIILKEVNKGLGLHYLCQELGITSDQVLAFGDNLNDLEMMQFAGTAIAPENAREEIKAVANQVIAHHNQASVLNFMEEMMDDSI